jgi:transposase-like protein
MQKTKYSDKQKAQVALEAIKGQKTLGQISSQYQVHPTQIRRWQSTALEGLVSSFSKDNQKDKMLAEKDKQIEELYKVVGQRDIELEWLKKKFKMFEP